jgi:serine/threonine protein kinase
VWAFGCTLYECAVGKPPNSDVREPQQLRTRMRRLNQSIELPENGTFSSGLRSLVSYTLTPDAATRPSFSDVLAHEYLANTEDSHPTIILSELVKVYYSWLYGGGQRASLFMPGGAAAGDTPGSLTTSDEEWNFSATDNFENRMSTVLDIPDFSNVSDMQGLQGDLTPRAQEAAATGERSMEDKANFEERVRRGADLSNIFDQNKPNYEYITKTDFIPIQQRRVSDLPLRAMSEERPYSIANQVIDLGDFDSSNYAAVAQAKDERIKLADAATIKANRGNSRVYSDLSSSETLTARSTTTVNGESSAPSDGQRPATQDFSFPPKEWNTQDRSAKEAGTEDPSKPRDQSKHKTMEWSFASAMSEAQSDDAKPSPILEEETKPKKHDTMQWSFQSAMAEVSPDTSTTQQQQQQRQQRQPTSRRAPPPFLRSTTEPVGANITRPSTSHSESDSTSTHDEADPFALDDADNEHPPAIMNALDETGISSFYGRERQGALRGLSEGEAVPGGAGREGGENEGDEGRKVVTMPAIHGVDARVLDGDAPSSALELELGRLLGDFQGVLGGAGEAVEAVGRRGRGRRREERRGGGGGGGESEWEDEDEE